MRELKAFWEDLGIRIRIGRELTPAAVVMLLYGLDEAEHFPLGKFSYNKWKIIQKIIYI